VHARTALLISLALIALGSSIIFCAGGWTALVLGLFAVAWYNGFYTYLKQKTALAAVPGALTGAIPPALGWVCGGGSLLDSRVWGIAFFFFIWQVPHFWLLFLDFAEDYERAGLPSLKKIFTAEQLRRIVFIWILSTAVSSLSIPLFGFVNSYPALVLLLLGTFWIIWNGMGFWRTYSDGISLKGVFTKLNAYVFAVILLLFLDVISSPLFLP
jgi:protoheme IX farnesyltransferase